MEEWMWIEVEEPVPLCKSGGRERLPNSSGGGKRNWELAVGDQERAEAASGGSEWEVV